jgi:hypothetical protein
MPTVERAPLTCNCLQEPHGKSCFKLLSISGLKSAFMAPVHILPRPVISVVIVSRNMLLPARTGQVCSPLSACGGFSPVPRAKRHRSDSARFSALVPFASTVSQQLSCWLNASREECAWRVSSFVLPDSVSFESGHEAAIMLSAGHNLHLQKATQCNGSCQVPVTQLSWIPALVAEDLQRLSKTGR